MATHSSWLTLIYFFLVSQDFVWHREENFIMVLPDLCFYRFCSRAFSPGLRVANEKRERVIYFSNRSCFKLFFPRFSRTLFTTKRALIMVLPDFYFYRFCSRAFSPGLRVANEKRERVINFFNCSCFNKFFPRLSRTFLNEKSIYHGSPGLLFQ